MPGFAVVTIWETGQPVGEKLARLFAASDIPLPTEAGLAGRWAPAKTERGHLAN